MNLKRLVTTRSAIRIWPMLSILTHEYYTGHIIAIIATVFIV